MRKIYRYHEFLVHEKICFFCSSIFYLKINLYKNKEIFQIFRSGFVTFCSIYNFFYYFIENLFKHNVKISNITELRSY